MWHDSVAVPSVCSPPTGRAERAAGRRGRKINTEAVSGNIADGVRMIAVISARGKGRRSVRTVASSVDHCPSGFTRSRMPTPLYANYLGCVIHITLSARYGDANVRTNSRFLLVLFHLLLLLRVFLLVTGTFRCSSRHLGAMKHLAST